MRYIFKFIILSTLLLFVSCSSSEPSDSEMLARDQAELEEQLDTGKVLFHKFIRIAIQSQAFKDGKGPTNEVLISEDVVASINMLLETNDLTSISLYEYYQIYRAYSKTRSFLNKVDVDEYPPLMAGLHEIIFPGKRIPYLELDKEYIEALRQYEHLLLASAAMSGRSASLEISLFELNELETGRIIFLMNETSNKSLLDLTIALIYMMDGLPYLAEQSINEAIKQVEDSNEESFSFPPQLNPLQNNKPLIVSKEEFLGYLHVARALDRLSMERDLDKDRAHDDFITALDLFRQAGVNNEIVQIAKVFVAIEDENYNDAVFALKELQKSQILSPFVKDELNKSIDYLESRDPDSALNFLSDKVFISRLIFDVTSHYITQENVTEWSENAGIEYPRELLEAQASIDKIYTKIKELEGSLDFEKIENDLQGSGKNLWDKAKGILQ